MQRVSLDHDIALVRLATPVNTSFAALDAEGLLRFGLQHVGGAPITRPVLAAGYGAGLLSDGRTLPPGTLTWLVDERGRFRVVDRARCVLVEGAGPAGTVCGGFDDGTRNTCAGDSGGPVFDAATGVVVAITSAAHSASSLCVRTAASPGRLPALGRYTAVAPYMDWLLTHIPADQLLTGPPPQPAGPPMPPPPTEESPRTAALPPPEPVADTLVDDDAANKVLAACGLIMSASSFAMVVWVTGLRTLGFRV